MGFAVAHRRDLYDAGWTASVTLLILMVEVGPNLIRLSVR